jgi:uncharacterized protein YwgA
VKKWKIQFGQMSSYFFTFNLFHFLFFTVEKKITCYCQNCRAANTVGETSCRRCGTRLLLVVFPQSLKYDTNHVPSFYEDHLLERVSLLELRLAQVTEQLAMAYEFISREAKSFQRDHALLESFFETLQTVNPDFSELLSQKTLEHFDEKKENLAAKNKEEKFLDEIFAAHDGVKQIELFSHLVKGRRQTSRRKRGKAGVRQSRTRRAIVAEKRAAARLHRRKSFSRRQIRTSENKSRNSV